MQFFFLGGGGEKTRCIIGDVQKANETRNMEGIFPYKNKFHCCILTNVHVYSEAQWQ